MQTIKDASLLILLVLVLSSVRIQSLGGISLEPSTVQAAETARTEVQSLYEHPALVQPSELPAGSHTRIPGNLGDGSSPDCELPDVKCQPGSGHEPLAQAKSDCIA